MALLPLPLLLAGCDGSPPRQTLHVVMVPTDRVDWMRSDIQDGRLMEPLVKAFQRLQPNVSVEVTIQNQEGLAERLQTSSSQGLAPDLLMLRSPQAVDLLMRGLIDPLPGGDPSIRPLFSLVHPSDLSRVSTAQGVAGLPMFSEFTVACYDRTRLAQPPASLNELLQVAASGHPVGLSVDPFGLWWTAGALGAQKAMTPILISDRLPPRADQPSQRHSIAAWLGWLRQAALQSRVEIESGPQALTEGLESGRLAWVPCFSLTLLRLDRTMGARLGVAPLPSGPGGPPSPFSTTRVWSLGRDSSAEQRRLALKFAALSLDPLIQRQLMLQGRTFLPANRFVPIPVGSSGRLGVLAIANEQFEQALPLLDNPFPIDLLNRRLPKVERVVMDVMVGVSSPAQGAEALWRLPSQTLPPP